MKRKAVSKIPEHLLPFVAEQDASLYSPIDHAAWRFILRISQTFFKEHAHQKYLDGLKLTGISTEKIPSISEMDRCLRRFGWRAVGVIGFIPPSVFMEFQSLGILPIACDMRQLDHLAYTPAPDIVHEAAGHAPILADPEYAEYLRAYGEVARKAIYSNQDMRVYEAIRKLSDVKEDPDSSNLDIARVQQELDHAIAENTYVSEATYLSRMNWWTVEYGLVGSMQDPKIYGAGLLSSVGESYNCLKPEVRKVPFTLDCINTAYDITRPQPQLFVTSGFQELTKVLHQMAATMAFKRGGMEGLSKAKIAGTVTTAVLDTGLQISGGLVDFSFNARGEPVYLKYDGPSQLSMNDRELKGHGAEYHKQGFSTPLGKIKNAGGKSADRLTARDLEKLGFKRGQSGKLVFASGIELTGTLSRTFKDGKKNLILQFKNCSVTWGERILFQPEWGTFDMACGSKVVSVFGGAADRGKYATATDTLRQGIGKQKSGLKPEDQPLAELYAKVREVRESKDRHRLNELTSVADMVLTRFRTDWLLPIEILEVYRQHGLSIPQSTELHTQIERIAGQRPELKDVVARGIALLEGQA